MIDFIFLHLDYLSSALSLFGYYRLSKVKVDGWIWSLLGNSVLVTWAIYNESAYGLMIGNLTYITIKIYSYIKWKKNKVGEIVND